MPLRYATLWILLLSVLHAHAQEAVTLSGAVVDAAQAGIESATVRLESPARGIVRTVTTGGKGAFAFDGLAPGEYTLVCSHRRYATVRIPAIVLHARDQRSFTIDMGALTAGNTPSGEDTESLGVSTGFVNHSVLEPGLLRALPWNGRNAATFTELVPGIGAAALPSPSADPEPQTSYFANGLRPSASYLVLDGVTANAGNGGDAAAIRGVGAGDWMHSLDAMEEVVVQSAPISPALGRTAGAQVVLRSRSGGNDTHGSLYGYFRNRALSANDWFANHAGLEKPGQSFRNFGATLGGALARDRTFYFLSYEGMHANLPQSSVMDVPDEAARMAAPADLQPYLWAFPLPNGPATGEGTARYTAAATAHSRMNPWSARLDHRLSENVHTFLRYSYNPTDASYRGTGFQSPASITRYDASAHAVTAGLTWNASPRMSNDLRVNYSRNTAGTTSSLDGLGGAVPLNLASLLPEGATAANSLVQFNVLGLGSYSAGTNARLRQEQVHVVNGITLTDQRHTFKFGVDYRRIYSTIFQPAYTLSATFSGLDGEEGALLSGVAASAVVASHEPTLYPGFTNFSMYAEDTWRVSERLSLLYGLRWDVNTAPEVRRGPTPVSLVGSTGVSRFDPLYDTSWGNLAPRGGLAYLLDTTPGKEMVFRLGIGLFRELPYSSTSEFVGGAPYSSHRFLRLTAFPLTAEQMGSPSLPPERPYGQINVTDGLLKSPSIVQWNAAIERMLGNGQSFSIGYVGTRGRDLLLTQNQPLFTSDYSILRLLSNESRSDYHGLQLSYRRPVGTSLTTQVSYTWAHSIDTASHDHASVLPGFSTIVGTEKGDSDFDVRHTLSFAGTYRLPSPREGVLGTVFKDWSVEWMLSARSALPLNVVTMTAEPSDTRRTVAEDEPGLFALVRANYMGLPVWISDASAPGGKRLNPEAFAVPTGYTQGTLGRNLIRGFDMWQADLSLSRRIELNEHANVLVQAQAFNAFNRGNFANPFMTMGANLASPGFGLSSGTLGASANSGIPAMFGRGGPRTLQLGIRVEF